MDTIPGIVENGAIRLLAPLVLPERTMVTIVPAAPEASPPKEIGCNSDELYALLNERFNSGVRDAAARVDELDP